MKLLPIHPFPARMAPEIVFEELEGLPPAQTILDPMSGSGTVLRGATELGHHAIGFDLDPLAVLMATVWTTSIDAKELVTAANNAVLLAKNLDEAVLPWVDDCEETQLYIKFWFLPAQIAPLRRLAAVLAMSSGKSNDALKIALSRIIVTKERGASVARDTSHSRPHRVFMDNAYDVYEGFLMSAKRLAARLESDKLIGSAVVNVGDSRSMSTLKAGSVDVVITSPPYLNAIDYLRGHRLALVWLGFKVSQVRTVRSKSIGAESSAASVISTDLLSGLLTDAGDVHRLPARHLGMVKRYAQDVYTFMQEIRRVVKAEGQALLVVGDSCLAGVPISNADLCASAAHLSGFRVACRTERELPMSRRYLPTPTTGTLGMRMKTETLLSLAA